MKAKLAKILLALMLVFTGSAFANITVASQSASAASCDNNATFLNFRAWWFGLCDASTGELMNPSTRIGSDGKPVVGNSGKITITHFVWKIVFNVMDILLNIIAYAAVFFVLMGGFNILFSSGDPGRVSKGKQTLTHAVLGVVVALLAGGLVRFANDALIGSGSNDLVISGTGQAIHISNSGGGGDPDAAWIGATSALLMVAGIGAVLMVVWGGVKLSMSSGDPQAAAKAKNTIIFALIGAVIMIAASFIVRIAVSSVTGTP